MNDLIQDAVFEMFPQLFRGIVIAKDLTLSEHNPRIATFLADTTVQRRTQGRDILNAPGVTEWDEAHKRFGSNPKKYPPSIRSLLHRVLSDKPLPYINDAVALFNAISLKYILPCGGDDLDVIAGDLCLGLASGEERFVPLGATETEHPESKEVIYYDTDDLKVMCRRWNWRNGSQTKITTATRNILINIDGLGDSFRPTVEEATKELAQWLRTECQGSAKCDLMHGGNRSVDVLTAL